LKISKKNKDILYSAIESILEIYIDSESKYLREDIKFLSKFKSDILDKDILIKKQ
jgi:hypothetical protein